MELDIKRWISFRSLATLLVGLWLLGHFSFLGWLSDLASHFQVQYLLMSLGLLIYAVKKKYWKFLLPLLVVLGFSCAAIVPYWLSSKAMHILPSQPKLRLMQVNVLYTNQGYRRVARAIEQQDPDILSLQEVDPKWMNALRPILKKYPYRVEHIVWKRSCGLALYGKRPFFNRNIHDYGDVGRAVLLTDIKMGSQTVRVVAMHPYSPGKPWRYRRRDRQLMSFACERSQMNPYLIVMGDLNNTPFSPSFKKFLQLTGLQDTRLGQGLHPTWPSIFPPMWIPIDHILVSPQFTVKSFQSGPYTGSDHFPVVVDVALKSVK